MEGGENTGSDLWFISATLAVLGVIMNLVTQFLFNFLDMTYSLEYFALWIPFLLIILSATVFIAALVKLHSSPHSINSYLLQITVAGLATTVAIISICLFSRVCRRLLPCESIEEAESGRSQTPQSHTPYRDDISIEGSTQFES
jgi:hypothetical protein